MQGTHLSFLGGIVTIMTVFESLSRPAIFDTSSGSGVGVLDIAHTNFMRRPHPRLEHTLDLYFSEKLARMSTSMSASDWADHAHVFRSQLTFSVDASHWL